nr:MAG TPA: hypothetical protein [Caudoviricetes sp.]
MCCLSQPSFFILSHFLKSQTIKNQAALDVPDPAPLVRCSPHKICDDSQPLDNERKDVRDD